MVRTFTRKKKKKKVRVFTRSSTKKKKKKKVHKFVAKQDLTKKSKKAPVIKLEPKKKKKTSVKEVLVGDPLTKGKEKIKTGTLPIGTGGVGVIKSAAKGLKIAFGGTKAASKTIKLSRPLRKIGQQINVNQIGKSAGLTKAQTSALAKQIGRERINILARHAVNPKSTSLTKKIIMSVGGSAALVGVIGSYPFAGFIKEESLQTLGFATRTAQEMGDIEGMETAIKEQEEILNPDAMDKLISAIPYANVVKQLKDFYDAASTKLEQDKRFLEEKRNEEPEEDKWAAIHEEQAARDEEARQKDLKEMQWKAEYYDLIRNGDYEEAEELLQSKMKGGN